MKNARKKANDVNQQPKSLLVQTRWLLVGSVSLLLIALLAQKYLHSESASNDNTLTDNDDILVETSGDISTSCETQLNAFKLRHSNAWQQDFIVYADIRIQDNVKFVDEERTKCRQAFLEIVNEDHFFPNLISKNKLQVVLLPESFMDGSYGIYDYTQYTMGIAYRRHTTIAQYKRFLRNEYFSHQVHMMNLENKIKPSDPMLITFPYLNDKGEISERTFKKCAQALKTDYRRVLAFKRLLIENSGHCDKNSCEKLLQLAKNYDPNVYYLTEEQYQEALLVGVVTEMDQNGYFVSGPNHPRYLATCYGHKKNDQITYTYAKDNSALSKAIALLRDIEGQYKAIENPLGPYQKLNNYFKKAELTSFIAEYPSEIVKFMFPGVYNATCEFFTNVNTSNNLLTQDREVADKKTAAFFSKNENRELFFPQNQNKQKSQESSKQKHTTTRMPRSNKYHHGAR